MQKEWELYFFFLSTLNGLKRAISVFISAFFACGLLDRFAPIKTASHSTKIYVQLAILWFERAKETILRFYIILRHTLNVFSCNKHFATMKGRRADGKFHSGFLKVYIYFQISRCRKRNDNMVKLESVHGQAGC